MSTTEIINDFVSKIDTDKAYTLKELKDALDEIYKAHNTGKKPAARKTKKTADEKAAAEAKPKRQPSAYNNFVKQRMQELKETNKGVPPRELMSMAASQWKELSKAEQERFKIAA
jgi:hypothetical protein